MDNATRKALEEKRQAEFEATGRHYDDNTSWGTDYTKGGPPHMNKSVHDEDEPQMEFA